MSDLNASAIAVLLSQSLQTVQSQVQTQSNLLAATNVAVASNSQSISVASTSISTSSNQIVDIIDDITDNSLVISNLATKQQTDNDNLQSQVTTNLTSLNNQITKQ